MPHPTAVKGAPARGDALPYAVGGGGGRPGKAGRRGPGEEALLPFLLARSNKHRVELAQWLSQKRDFSTVREMIRVFRMNKVNLQDYLRYEKEDEEAGDRALREFLEAGLEAFPDIADKIRREALEESLQAVVMQTLRVRFGAEEAAWAPRLALLDAPGLEALHLRALQVASEADLLP
jgi:hypothetical protein